MFRKTGVTHLIVISGSHISLVAGLVYLLLRRFWIWTGVLRIAPQQAAAWGAWLAALFYAGLAGFSIPTQRAVIMLSAALAALVWQRHTGSLRVLLLALFAVLLFDPLAVLSVGFWLSFLAVGLLMYLTSGRLGKPGVWHNVVVMQAAMAMGLSPLLLVFFQQVSLVSPLANLLAVPVLGFLVTPVALLAVVVSLLFQDLATGLLMLADWMLQAVYWLLVQLANWPQAVVSMPPPPGYALVFAVIGTALLLAPRGFPARYLGLLLFLPLMFVTTDKPKPGEVWLTLLNEERILHI